MGKRLDYPLRIKESCEEFGSVKVKYGVNAKVSAIGVLSESEKITFRFAYAHLQIPKGKPALNRKLIF